VSYPGRAGGHAVEALAGPSVSKTGRSLSRVGTRASSPTDIEITNRHRGGCPVAADDTKFAFPRERKEPIHDAAHVRNAIARFDQVEGVSDAERDEAWKRITAAAKKFNVEVSESDWHELFEGGNAKKR
jgi:uncharacterized protein DUF6582